MHAAGGNTRHAREGRGVAALQFAYECVVFAHDDAHI